MSSGHSHTTEIEGVPHAHHWDPISAYHGAKLGMWLFLATEILLFAVMFTGYALFKWTHFPEFHAGSQHLNWKLGTLNTAILLISSYTAAMAVYAAQIGNNKGVVKNFAISILCGAGFMVVKFFEYRSKYEHGFFPGGENFHEFKNFLGFYFCLTGLHGLHVLIGMGLLTWVALRATKGEFNKNYYTPVELGALYWHLVDLIWIYLFPLLYLVG